MLSDIPVLLELRRALPKAAGENLLTTSWTIWVLLHIFPSSSCCVPLRAIRSVDLIFLISLQPALRGFLIK